MNKTKKLILLPLIALALTSCKGAVAEVYQIGEFHTNDFLANYFTTFPAKLKESKYTQNNLVIDLEANDFSQSHVFSSAYQNAIFKDFARGHLTLAEMVAQYGDDNIKSMYAAGESELAIAYAMPNSTKATWFEYAKHQKLSNYHESFKHGIFSKLTEGLLSCDGSGSLVRIQLNESGFGQIFSQELNQYSALTLSLRGGTNIPFAELGIPRVNTASINLKVSFYIPESISNDARQVTFHFPIPALVTDKSLETNVIQLYFDEVMDQIQFAQLKRANAMSISFDLLDHELIRPAGVDDPNNDYEFAVMMYEVMFPNAVWN